MLLYSLVDEYLQIYIWAGEYFLQVGQAVGGARVRVEERGKDLVTSSRGEFWRLLTPGLFVVCLFLFTFLLISLLIFVSLFLCFCVCLFVCLCVCLLVYKFQNR